MGTFSKSRDSHAAFRLNVKPSVSILLLPNRISSQMTGKQTSATMKKQNTQHIAVLNRLTRKFPTQRPMGTMASARLVAHESSWTRTLHKLLAGPVGSFPSNGYGLNDMAGNVFEWCWDWGAEPPYPAGSPYLGGADPRGPADLKSSRVVRGGAWDFFPSGEQCTFRDGSLPAGFYNDVGFRCVRGL
jgi:formylglycine-generating enzyme required for sulfatase activity